MRSLNLSKLKKVSSDKDATVFRHQDGHTVRIAHNALSPKMKAELDKLPIHAAEGVDTEPKKEMAIEPSEDQSERPPVEQKPQAPVVVNVGTQPQTPQVQAPVAAPQAQAAPDQSQQQAPQQSLAPQQQSQSEQQTASETPQIGPQGPSNAYQKVSAVAPAEAAARVTQNAAPPSHEILKEDQAWTQDLANQHITPKTYSDLFHDKETTLGKIGMIFGMLASGAGSGLSGQPNAMLAMMNQQINNDLAAQTKSKDNAQNYLRMMQQHKLNEAQSGLVQAQSFLTAAQADAAHQLTAKMLMDRSAAQNIWDKQIASLPEGPLKEARKNAYAFMIQNIDANHVELAQKFDATQALLKMGENTTSGSPKENEGPVNYQRFNQLQRASQLKLPGAPSEADLSNMTKEASQLDEVVKLHKDFNDAWEALNKKALAGALNPGDREAFVNSLSGKLTKVAEGRYSSSAHSLADSMFPNWKDFGTTRADKDKMDQNFFNILSAGMPTLTRFGVINKGALNPKSESQPEIKTMNGIKYKKVPNGWQRAE